MLDAWRSPPASGPLARLEWVRIEDGAVVVRDRALALDWGIKGLAAELSRRHVETIDLTGSFEAANAETRAEVSFGGAFELERRRLGLELELADAELGQIARLHSTLASLAHLDLSVAARARLTLDAGELVADPIEIRLTGERAQAPAVVRGDARWAAATKTLSATASTVGFDLSLLAPLSAPLAERLAAAPPVPALDADIDVEASPERRKLHATVRASTDEAPFSTLIATLEHVPGQGRSDVVIEIETLRPWRLATLDARLAHLRGVEVALDGTVRGSVSADALALAVSLAGHEGQLQIAGIPTAPVAIDGLELEATVAGTAAAPRLDRGELRIRAGTITAAAARPPGPARLRGQGRARRTAARARRSRSVLACRPRAGRALARCQGVRVGHCCATLRSPPRSRSIRRPIPWPASRCSTPRRRSSGSSSTSSRRSRR